MRESFVIRLPILAVAFALVLGCKSESSASSNGSAGDKGQCVTTCASCQMNCDPMKLQSERDMTRCLGLCELESRKCCKSNGAKPLSNGCGCQ